MIDTFPMFNFLDNHIEFWDGHLRFNPWLLLLGFCVIAHAVFHYRRYCYNQGFKIDLWHINSVLFLVSTVGIYPFASSDENSRSVGSKMWEIAQNVDRAYLLTLLGYGCAIGGFYLHGLFIRRKAQRQLKSHQIMAHVLGSTLTKTLGLQILTVACVLAQVFLISVVFLRTGQLFNLRSAIIDNGALRPLFNFAFTSASPILMTWWLLKFFHTRNKWNLAGFAAIAIPTLVAGIRGPLIAPFISVMPLYWMTQRMNVRIWKIAVVALVALVLAVGFAELRRGGDRSDIDFRTKTGGELAYGNSLSDIRDFAWILTGWDETRLLGKTYLAGFLGFVPRQYMPYREEWGLGRFTARIAGLNTDVHAGLRPGLFGEAYLNFGITGVILGGLITGLVWRLYDFHAKQEIYLGRGVVHMYRWITPYVLLSAAQITAGVFRFYVFMILVLMAYVISMLQKGQRPAR